MSTNKLYAAMFAVQAMAGINETVEALVKASTESQAAEAGRKPAAEAAKTAKDSLLGVMRESAASVIVNIADFHRGHLDALLGLAETRGANPDSFKAYRSTLGTVLELASDGKLPNALELLTAKAADKPEEYATSYKALRASLLDDGEKELQAIRDSVKKYMAELRVTDLAVGRGILADIAKLVEPIKAKREADKARKGAAVGNIPAPAQPEVSDPTTGEVEAGTEAPTVEADAEAERVAA